jgi:predicted secreted protein
MSWVSGLAIYFIIWWVVLFAVLPWGLNRPEESDPTSPAAMSGAPETPRLLAKVIATTVISGVIFAIVAWIYRSGSIGLDDIPFLPRY